MMNTTVKRFLARGCELVIGLFFVVGAVPKALDINRFSVQMSAYHVVTDKAYLPWFALFTLSAEMALGVAMLLGLRLRGLTVLCLELMLTVFTVLIVYAWLVHGLEDCGCFPLVKMTPPVSIAKNVLLFLLGCVSWQVLVRKPAASTVETALTDEVTEKPFSWRGAALRFVIAFAAAAGAVGYAAPRVEQIATAPPVATANGETAGIDYSQFVFMTDMGSFDLGKGTYLVPILSMTCDECKSHVPELNELMSQPDMLPMVALCYEDAPGDLDKFRAETQPLFPLHVLGNQPLLYFNLRGDGHFRMSLVRDGRALKHFDDKVPTAEEVTATLKSAAPPVQ